MTTATLPVVHRRSALEAFRCPRRYKALYIDQVPDESDPARRGSAFHAAAHRYITALRREGRTDDYELAELALRDGIAETICPSHLVPEVTQLFWRWVESFELDLNALLVVEERQRSDAGYSWQPDLVYAYDDLLEVRDWKTHWAPFTEAQARAEFQARWYMWQARQLWPGFQRYRIVFVFIRWGVEVAAEFQEADLNLLGGEVEGVVAAIAEAMRTDTFPANPGQHCGVCSLTCPVVDHPERVPLRLVTREQAENAFRLKLALDQTARQVDDALRGWCDAHGPLVVAGMELAHRAAPKTTYPIQGVLEVYRAFDETPDFDISRSSLRRPLTIKRFAHMVSDLESVAKVKPGTRFSAKKVGVVDVDEEE